MNLWDKTYLLARYRELLKREDREFIAQTIDGLQGTGKLNDQEIEEYLEPWKIKKIKRIYESSESKITEAIYSAEKD